MENITPYNIYEWIALIASIIVGSSAYIFFVAEKKNQHLRFRFVIMVLLVNTIFTWIASEILRYKGWGELRGIVLVLVAFTGQWIVEYIDKRYLKLGDAAIKKVTGIDINKNNEYEQREEYFENKELVEEQGEDKH
jgi:uncharacterized membrane protein YeaQ/YmgE (transglycosylase-associated protein family)